MKRLLLFCIFMISLSLSAQNNLIPNTSDCSATRPPFAFDIQRAWISATGQRVDTRHTPIVGDIDGDGMVEIFASNGMPGNGGVLYVFNGKTGSLKGQINCPGIGQGFSNGFCLFKRSETSKGSVFIAGRDNRIYLYEVLHSSSSTITFSLVWSFPLNIGFVVPVVADLNGDGKVEIVAGRYIIDANTGSVLSTLTFKGGNGTHPQTLSQSFPLVADVDKDGLPEVIVGTYVYKFNGGFTSSPSPWRVCPRYASLPIDGANIAADVDQDGNVDLVFVYGYKNGASILGNCDVTVWTPVTGTEVGRFSMALTNGISYPFVGDIDGEVINGKKYPEICINTANHLRAFKYNGTSFSLKWDMTHNDGSGATILTLFDFNLDGVVELVYRDEKVLRILDGRGLAPVDAATPIACGSATIVETPVIADVTGDGSANIIVTGNISGKNDVAGELMVFEGKASKWASCPNVWNQQLYSPLLVNTNLTIPQTVKAPNHTYTRPDDHSTVQYYNGGPMQAPYISDETYRPIDLSPDIYIVSGSITINSATSVTFTITYGNQGLAVAPSSTPIRYYKNSILTSNLIGSDVLGVEVHPGQTHTISKTITGLSPMPTQLYVRILDDGSSFPASGAYSDCNLTNNKKSFGTLELNKTVNVSNACVDGTSIFTIKLKNNTNQTATPTTFNNIVVIDSLGTGWQYLTTTVVDGSVSAYNPLTRSIKWTLPTLAPGNEVQLLITAKATAAGSIRNTAWVQSVGTTIVGKEAIEAYVIVNSTQAPVPATISPANVAICGSAGNVTLTASVVGANSYQWYKNNLEITGATAQTYIATSVGSYSVTYFDGTCVSQMSAARVIVNKTQATSATITAITGVKSICYNSSATLTAQSMGVTNPIYKWYNASNTLLHTGQSYTTGTLTTSTTYYVSVEGDNYCENLSSDRKSVNVTVYGNLTSGVIGSTQTVCSGIAPSLFTQITAATGGTGIYSYQWQQSADGITWANIGGATSSTYTSPALTSTTYFRRGVTSSTCGTVYSNSIKITVRQLVSYPDFRVQACPEGVINLTKYIDTTNFRSIKWTPSATFVSGGINSGVINDVNQLVYPSTYKFNYEVESLCGTHNGMLYLTIAKNNVKLLLSEVRICKDDAQVLNLNALLGVEAAGVWTSPTLGADAYLSLLNNLPFAGQVFFRGKDAWDNNIGVLNGTDREIVLIYTTLASSCLNVQSFTVKIILTPDIVN